MRRQGRRTIGKIPYLFARSSPAWRSANAAASERFFSCSLARMALT